MKKMTKVVVIVMMVSAGITYGAIGDIWDWANDYSGVSNPNGP